MKSSKQKEFGVKYDITTPHPELSVIKRPLFSHLFQYRAGNTHGKSVELFGSLDVFTRITDAHVLSTWGLWEESVSNVFSKCPIKG